MTTTKMADVEVKRLTLDDRELARTLFATMADIFEEDRSDLSDGYIDKLLGNDDFWAIAAMSDGSVIGGLTAHTLPMTTYETSELFVYDIAVHADYRRRGVGRQLLNELRKLGSDVGAREVCVPADMEDLPALDFYRALKGVETSVAFFSYRVKTQ
jgi:aminoglycoside 3-N-acetyltransferase I